MAQGGPFGRAPLARLLAVIALTVAGCVPPPNDAVLPEFEDERLVRQIRSRGEIRIAIPSDFPALGLREPPEGAPARHSTRVRGFAADVGSWVAQELRVPARLIAAPASELLTLLRRERAELVFPAIPITEKAARENTFTNPYYIAHQRLLVPEGSAIRSIEQLAGKSVCSFIDPKTEVALSDLQPRIHLIEASTIHECQRLLGTGEVDAVTAADVYLFDILVDSRGYELAGDELSTEGYGGVVQAGASGFADFVDEVLYDAIEDGRWTTSYRRWIGGITKSRPETPALRVEEAASLFPIGAPVSKRRTTR